jgi:hypothetical protein
LGDLGVDGKLLLKWILKEIRCDGVGGIHLTLERAAGSCEYSDGTQGSDKR